MLGIPISAFVSSAQGERQVVQVLVGWQNRRGKNKDNKQVDLVGIFRQVVNPGLLGVCGKKKHN